MLVPAPRSTRLLACLGFVVLTAAAASCGGPSTERRDPVDVSVSVSSCGKGWTGGTAGMQRFTLHNVDTRTGEIDLIGASTGAVYAEVEPLAAGTSADLYASLGAGRYAFRCSMEDEASVQGKTVVLSGSARGDTPAVAPVSQDDLVPAAQGYQRYVIARLPALLAMTTRLRRSISSGSRVAAQRDWLPAHLAYQRLGAAYDAFGDVDADINGVPEGLPRGVRDPSWRGFHRLEYGLWHGEALAGMRATADLLVRDVAGLLRHFPPAQVAPLDIGIRAHEITEDAAEFALTGRDDFGSHSGLATVRADLAGTRAVLTLVGPLLAPRYSGMDALDGQLRTAAHDLDEVRVDDRWPAVDALGRSARERIDSDISGLAEALAPVATILEPRRTS